MSVLVWCTRDVNDSRPELFEKSVRARRPAQSTTAGLLQSRVLEFDAHDDFLSAFVSGNHVGKIRKICRVNLFLSWMPLRLTRGWEHKFFVPGPVEKCQFSWAELVFSSPFSIDAIDFRNRVVQRMLDSINRAFEVVTPKGHAHDCIGLICFMSDVLFHESKLRPVRALTHLTCSENCNTFRRYRPLRATGQIAKCVEWF